MKAWDIVSEILTTVVAEVKPGVTTGLLSIVAEEKMKELGAISYNKGYFPKWEKSPFPDVLCTSVNSQIAHGIPNMFTELREGDIINIDMGIIDKDGQCGDCCITVPVGEISREDQTLLHYAKKITYAGIEAVKAGATNQDLVRAMERVAGERGFYINRNMCGHGCTKIMHDDPMIVHTSNYGKPGTPEYAEYQGYLDQTLKAGQIICIEPCVTNGKDPYGRRDPKGWTWYTQDGKKSAQFEHMVLVKEDGYEILTTHFKPFVKPV